MSDTEDKTRLISFDLDACLHHEEPDRALRSPVTLADLAVLFAQLPVTRHLFQPYPEIEAAYWLNWRGEKTAVTFSAEQFEQHPDTLHFLSYGRPIMAEILAAIPTPESYPAHLARFTADDVWPIHAWYDLRGDQPRLIDSFTTLRQTVMAQNVMVDEGQVEIAQKQFVQETEALTGTYQHLMAQCVRQQRAILQPKARRLLEQATLIEIALDQQRSLFESECSPTGFNQETVKGLKRYGGIWTWLLVVATNKGESLLPRPEDTDPYYEQIRNEKPEMLKDTLAQIAEAAGALVQLWKRMTES